MYVKVAKGLVKVAKGLVKIAKGLVKIAKRPRKVEPVFILYCVHEISCFSVHC